MSVTDFTHITSDGRADSVRDFRTFSSFKKCTSVKPPCARVVRQKRCFISFFKKSVCQFVRQQIGRNK